MRFFTILLCFFVISADLTAQNGCRVRVKLAGYNADTLWFGRTYAKRAQPSTFAIKGDDGWYELKNDSTLADGVYAILQRRAPAARLQSFSFVLAAGQRDFSIETSLDKPYAQAKITGSTENELFFGYMSEITARLDIRDSLNDQYRLRQTPAAYEALVGYEQGISDYQQSILDKNPNSVTARVVANSHYPKLGKGQNRYQTYRDDMLRFVNNRPDDCTRTPQFIEYMDFLVFKISDTPDSAQLLAAQVLKALEKDSTLYQYYFNYIINSFGGMSRFALDQAFVYMVRNYIEKGKAPWTTDEERAKMIRDADRAEPIFIGKPAPPLTLYSEEGLPQPLLDPNAEYQLLVFWDPECSHCKKELPILKRLCSAYPKMKVTAICGGKKDSQSKCWSFPLEEGLPTDWRYLSDPDLRSRFTSVYNLRSYPRVFILDKNKKILYRRGGEVSEEELIIYFDRLVK